MIDMHTHTFFSQDSELSPETYIKNAVRAGVDFLAVTDHMDIGCSPYEFESVINYNYYFDTFNRLRTQYPIRLAIGIECGYAEHNVERNKAVLAAFPFEYIINSVHYVSGCDCYYQEYFEGKSKKDAYNEFFTKVYESLDAPYYYDTVGHLSYITRNAPYPDNSVEQAQSGEIIDCILKKIIARGKILEVNANIKTFCPHTPDTNILKRYKELGGEYITFGSDAHMADKLVQNYNTVIQSIKACGFDYIFSSKNKKIFPHRI